jgi:hypothetical protein
MKAIPLLLLLAACQFSFGQTDTNIIAIGDWSAPVTDNGIWTLRGRLLVYDAPPQNSDVMWPEARVYLELQNDQTADALPLEVYFDSSLSFSRMEMRDGQDKLIPRKNVGISYHPPDPFIMVLPSDSTVRVRVDMKTRSADKPDGLDFCLNGGFWTVSPNATNDYYLSATFNSPTNHQSALNYHFWRGTLQLPKVKIPTPIKKP